MSPKEPVYGIVAAAGSGSRMRSERSKVFLEIEGRSVLERTVASLCQLADLKRLVVMVREEDLPEANRMLSVFPMLTIAVGGETRQDSVRKGLEAIMREASIDPERALVAVHDAARCLVDVAMVERVIEAARTCGAAIPALRVTDTVKRVGADGYVAETLARGNLWYVQTPQVFRMDLLLRAHALDCADATDDASLVERIARVSIVEGDPSNIKITVPDDIPRAVGILRNSVQ